MPGCSFGAWGMGHGWPGVLAVLLTLIAAAFIFVRLFESRRRNRDRRDSMAILRKRLAAGEITLPEFERLQRYL